MANLGVTGCPPRDRKGPVASFLWGYNLMQSKSELEVKGLDQIEEGLSSGYGTGQNARLFVGAVLLMLGKGDGDEI